MPTEVAKKTMIKHQNYICSFVYVIAHNGSVGALSRSATFHTNSSGTVMTPKMPEKTIPTAG